VCQNVRDTILLISVWKAARIGPRYIWRRAGFCWSETIYTGCNRRNGPDFGRVL